MVLRTPSRHALRRPANSRPPPGAAGLLAAAARHPFGFSLAIFALAAVLIGWPWLSGRVTIPWDAKAHFQPQIQFLAQSLARGDSPAWAPFVFSGHPQIADPQSVIFSPTFLVLALLDAAPSLWAVDAAVLAMVFLGGAALMLWFRDRGWHWPAGLIAALAFCYGASMAWRIQHTGQILSLAYLPVAMVCLDRALARASIPYGVAAGLVAACMVLGRDQVALLGIYLLAGLAGWRLLSASEPRVALRASMLPLGAGALCAALLIAVPVLLTAMLAQDSNRPSIDYIGAARGSLHPALLLTLVMPDVFGASGRMEDYWGPPSFAWPDTGIFLAQNMGELYIGAIPLLLMLIGRRPWTAVGAGDPLLHLCRGHCAPLCSRLVHAGLSRPVRAGAGRRSLSPAGGRGVPDRRARRDPGRLRRPSAARRAPRGHRPPAGDRSRAPPSGWRSCWRSAWGCGSAACPDSRCRCWRRSSRSPPRPPR